MRPDCVTVVIPTFNRVQKLENAVSSVLRETRIPLRVRVFDNMSSDGTEAFLTDLAARDTRVSFKRNEENIGAERNYVQALDSIETEYFVPLADDDWLAEGFLHEAYELLQTDPSVCAAAFTAEAVDAQGNARFICPSGDEASPAGRLSPRTHMREILRHGHYVWSSVLWRREVLDHLGYPYIHIGLPSDIDLQVQAFSKFPAIVSRKVGAYYRQHDDQSSAGFDMRSLPDWGNLFARMDRSTAHLFAPEDYANLRGQLARRYRSKWRKPAEEPIPEAEKLHLAAIAGVQLQDWQCAEAVLTASKPRAFDVEASPEMALIHGLFNQRSEKENEIGRERKLREKMAQERDAALNECERVKRYPWKYVRHAANLRLKRL